MPFFRTGPARQGYVPRIVPKASVLFLGLFFILAVSYLFGSEMVIVNKASNGREIRVVTGDMVRVELEQAGAAGYTWEIQDLDTKYFEVLKTETVGRPEPEDFVGAPVIRRWLLLAKKEGRVKLRFLHYRPWEGKESAVETFVLKVQIF